MMDGRVDVVRNFVPASTTFGPAPLLSVTGFAVATVAARRTAFSGCTAENILDNPDHDDLIFPRAVLVRVSYRVQCAEHSSSVRVQTSA
jgi:hypothetical protein